MPDRAFCVKYRLQINTMYTYYFPGEQAKLTMKMMLFITEFKAIFHPLESNPVVLIESWILDEGWSQ